MSRFLLFGDIISLSEAKGTKTRFLGRSRSASADVLNARIKSESEYKNGRKSLRKIEISKSLLIMQSKFFLFLSLSPKRKRKRNANALSLSLSLFTFGFSLFRPKVSERNNKRGDDLRKAFRISLNSVSCSGSWIFEKKKVTNAFLKKREIFSEFNQLSQQQQQL